VNRLALTEKHKLTVFENRFEGRILPFRGFSLFVPWIPSTVWYNLRTSSQKNVFKCIKNYIHTESEDWITYKTNYAQISFQKRKKNNKHVIR